MKRNSKTTFFLLGIFLLLIIAVTISFSWFTRPNGTGNFRSIQLEATAVIKSENCTLETFSANMESGTLVNDRALTTADTFTIAAGKVQYFKSVVTNLSSSDMNVSITDLLLSGANGAYINNLSPLKTTEVYSDHISVAEHITVEASASKTIEWYIYNQNNTDITVQFRSLPQVSYYD